MHIEVAGSGPDLVLIHGWAMHAGSFAPLVEALGARFTLHLVDLPGHGRSAEREGPLALAQTTARLRAALPARAVWLGWSLGGLFCLEAARSEPDSVRALALIASTPRFVSDTDWPHAVSHAVFEQFGRDLGEDYRAAVDRFLALECQGSDCMRADLRSLRAQVFAHGEPALHVLRDGLMLLADSDLRATLATLACPALWLAGARDRLVPAAALRWSAAQMPRGEFAAIAGGGHAPFVGHPDRVLAALLPWLDRLPP